MHERVDRPRAAAPGGVPLVVHRGQAGTGREHHAQRRMGRADVGGVPRPPGGLQLGGVPDDRGPPRRQRGGVGIGASGPGWTSTGFPARSATSSTAARRAHPHGVRTSVAGTCTPTNPRSRSRCQSVEVGLDRRDRGPRPEALGHPGRPLVPGVQQAHGRRAAQRLDAERRRQRQAGQADAVAGVLVQSPGHVVVRRVDLVRRLALRVERPPAQVRRARTRAQPVDELLGPQVLVQVDGRDRPAGGCWPTRRTDIGLPFRRI